MHFFTRSMLVLVGFGMLQGTTSTVLAMDPAVSVDTKETWFKTTYILKLNKSATKKLQAAIERVDPKLVGGALLTIGKHPAVKILITLVTNNADAFKRALNKEGAIGPRGITITLTSHGGELTTISSRMMAPLPWKLTGFVWDNMARFGLTTAPPPWLRPGPGKLISDTTQIVLNPWSWTIVPRE